MRFQQLKRDPNAVMRKKLVKSKKNWIVVSSLSIAGGLLLLGGPNTVAKADVATESAKVTAVAPSATTPDAGTSTKSESSTTSTTPAPETGTQDAESKDTTTEKTTGTDSAEKDVVTTPEKPVTDESVAKQDETTTDPAKETAELETQTAEKTTDTEDTVGTPEVAAYSAVAAPVAEQEDSSKDTTETDQPADVDEGTVTDADDAKVSDAPVDKDATAPVEGVVADGLLQTDALDGTNELVGTNALLSAQAADAVAPVAEDAVVDADDKGAGWTYTASNHNLDINGELTDFKGGDTDHWNGHTSHITNITVSAPITAPTDSSYMFANMTNLKSITDIDKLDTSGVTNAEGMFKNDPNITEIDLSNNNVNSMTNVSHMFENDSRLTRTKFNTLKLGIAKVVDASYAYANDTLLIDPGLAGWQVHTVKNLTGMFKNDSNITDLDLHGWYEFSGTKPETGDSSKGEGMFDGTDLSTIKLNGSMYFSPETALTSTHGTQWVNNFTNPEDGITTPATDKNFSGVPTFTDGTATGGIGSKFDNSGAVLSVYTFQAQAAPAGSVVSNIINIQTNHKGVTIPVIVKGTVGSETTIPDEDIPASIEIDGVTYTKQSDGTPIKAIISGSTTTTNSETTINYLGAANAETSVPVTKPDKSTTTLTIPAGNYGGTTTVHPEHIDGYIDPIVSVTYGENGTPTITQDGRTIDADHPVTYTGVTNDESTLTVKNPDGSTSDVTIPAGNYGDKPVEVGIPDQTGYNHTSVLVTYGEDGKPTITQDGKTIDADNPVTFTGVTNDESTLTVKNPDGSTSDVTIPAGNYGDKPVEVGIPDQTGYNHTSVLVTYGEDGKPTITQDGKTIDADNPVTFTGVTNDESTLTVKNPDGSTSDVTIPAGNYGDKPVEVGIPDQTGYNHTSVLVTYGEDGKPTITQDGKTIDADNPVTFTGKTVPATSTTVPTNLGDKPINIPSGTVGTTSDPINLEDVKGYLPVTVKVKYVPITEDTPNGFILITDENNSAEINSENKATYVGVKSDSPGTLRVKGIGNNPDSYINLPGGRYGQTKTVTADSVPGYFTPSVTIKYPSDPNETPTITDVNNPTRVIKKDKDGNYLLTYEPIPSGGSSSTNTETPEPNPNEGVIEHKVQTIATYSDKPDVEIYQLGSDNKMSMITNRMLKHQTNWYSDATITVDGVDYYRVATNEWAKVSQAYPYQALNLHIRTYDDSEKTLYKAENTVIGNETLAPSSGWITDRETYVINGTKYYRVATNKFVSADDVYVYSPVNMTVTTHADKYTNLYNAKGELVTNRSLLNNSSWKVDSVTYINGDKYYRVATNEFVKASDVDVNNMI
ncbi:SLAP domain-containing protein [Companilactobacillus insicii]|uniref:SLAP domain-containing protein n=1 Tax=Companilactobacillus insicii TaxID=1732567 RepID=UPI000F78ADEF|nr:BspA family leucine-rich repeat surface protein [Companilactobacillus insicii]